MVGKNESLVAQLDYRLLRLSLWNSGLLVFEMVSFWINLNAPYFVLSWIGMVLYAYFGPHKFLDFRK